MEGHNLDQGRGQSQEEDQEGEGELTEYQLQPRAGLSLSLPPRWTGWLRLSPIGGISPARALEPEITPTPIPRTSS